MKQDSSRDIEHGRGSATEALAESRTSLSEWQTDPELKFYGRAMSSATSKRLAGHTPYGRRVVRSRSVSRLGPTQPADDCRLDSSGDPALVRARALPEYASLRAYHGGLRGLLGIRTHSKPPAIYQRKRH